MLAAGQSIVDVAVAACRRHAEAIAFTALGADLDYARLERLSTAFAHWLVQAQGLQPGERVALQLPNLLQYPVVALGVLKAGGVLVNVNPLYTAPELEHQLRDSGAVLLVVCANTALVASTVVPRTAIRCTVVTELGDLHPTPRRLLVNFVVRHVKKLVPACRFPVQVALLHTLRQGAKLAAQEPGVLAERKPGPEDLAVLQYTGGTTGVAKGAMLSHRNLLANLAQLGEALGTALPEPGSVLVGPLPLYHVYAFTTTFLAGLVWGQQVLLIPNPRDIPGFVKTLRRYHINGFVGINTLYKALCDNADFWRLDFSGLRLCSSGGMALAPQIAERWLAITGCRVLEGYGLTECSPLVACNSYEAWQAGSVGHPVPGTELVLKDAEGRRVDRGAAGEICVRGPQVMQGYWQRPQESLQAFDTEGFLRTGDVGCFDDAGFLRIVDRIKDLIIVSGFNVYPTEIEDHVCTHPDIREAAAVGAGDDYAISIRLFVVSASATLTEDQVLAWCRQGLAPYKVPRQVEFRHTLPRSNIGKVLRRELRDAAAAASRPNG
jgi:long-chain acyl-CoA synthetase